MKGPVLNDILEAEEAIVKYTNDGTLPRIDIKEVEDGEYAVQYITEKKILDTMLTDIAKTDKGDTILLGMFFIAEHNVVNALIDAANRGVEVKMILDPMKTHLAMKSRASLIDQSLKKWWKIHQKKLGYVGITQLLANTIRN